MGEQCNIWVLLVEDNLVNQLVVKGLLYKFGCQVWIVEYGLNVLKMLEECFIDLVLMDCNMLVMDGYEVIWQICDSGCWGGLLIIVLIVNVLLDECECCCVVGMDDYLVKFFYCDELKVIFDCWCLFIVSDQLVL